VSAAYGGAKQKIAAAMEWTLAATRSDEIEAGLRDDWRGSQRLPKGNHCSRQDPAANYRDANFWVRQWLPNREKGMLFFIRHCA
jgi:hypothetical protein